MKKIKSVQFNYEMGITKGACEDGSRGINI
jgi:hypothetical protein